MLYFFIGLFGMPIVVIACFFFLPKISQRQVLESIRKIRYGKEQSKLEVATE